MDRQDTHPFGPVTALVLSAALTGCASLPGAGGSAASDPFEPINRVVFDLNEALDTALIRPVAEGYRTIVPQFMRDRIRAAIDNLAEPRVFANDVLQFRLEAAGITLARFVINTTVGLAGFFDRAIEQGYAKQSGDFGQTLYVWGMSDGPYLVLPLFGPSNFRDAIGLGVDLYTTPPAHLIGGHAGSVTNVTIGIVDGVDLRSRNIETLDEIKASALDFYAHLRSITRQHRAATLREGRGLPEEPQELIDPGASR